MTDIEITTGRNKNHLDSTFEKVKFECQVVGLDPKYSCNVRWYINNFPIDTATKKDIQSTRLSEAILRQDDWDKKYKPNMKVFVFIVIIFLKIVYLSYELRFLHLIFDWITNITMYVKEVKEVCQCCFCMMLQVKCSLQIKQAGFTSPGPEQFSDEFLAGFIVSLIKKIYYFIRISLTREY